MSYNPSVSIIVPCKRVDDYTRECVSRCKELDFKGFEILVLPDSAEDGLAGVKIIPTGPVLPGVKRNIGVHGSGGELCAFIDSDAYPRKDWLRNTVKYLQDSAVAGVGGPGITPETDSAMQKASGYILSSSMVGGFSRRYMSKENSDSDDIHSCNFIARKSVLEEAKGWDEHYWPGEDTLMCLAIKKTGKKLVEASDVVVYHHRRPLFMGHLRQVWNFGLHRGFFAKKFPENSRRLSYFLPSTFVLGLAAGSLLSLLIPILRIPYLALIAAYIALSLYEGLKTNNAKMVLPVFTGTILTHLAYGAAFLKGLATRNLKV
ncbi:MAG: glycosyltransferase [Candidatus Bathyarchaeota archaeon]